MTDIYMCIYVYAYTYTFIHQVQDKVTIQLM
jgi:hypothetical protein